MRFECRCSTGLRPAPSWGRSLRYVLYFEAIGAGGTRCWEILGLRFAALEMTVRHVPVRSLPADWYLRPLRTLTACSARILQRMSESANLSALGNPMQNFHSLKGQRELRRAFRLSADRPRMTVWAGREARNVSIFLAY